MLRVIAGKYKSRKLKDVKSNLTRPTTDKNKETIYNSVGQFFEGGACLDLFAGSGSLGIEALSRGMTHCDFVDKQYSAIKVIKENIKVLNLDEETMVYQKDALSFLNSTSQTYDLILVDPPYKLDAYQDILDVISSRHLLNKHGIIVMESDHLREVDPKNDLIKIKEKKLGQSKISIFERT